MEDETSSSEPLLVAVEAQNAAANGNGFCMDEERIIEARILSFCCLHVRHFAYSGAVPCLSMCCYVEGISSRQVFKSSGNNATPKNRYSANAGRSFFRTEWFPEDTVQFGQHPMRSRLAGHSICFSTDGLVQPPSAYRARCATQPVPHNLLRFQ